MADRGSKFAGMFEQQPETPVPPVSGHRVERASRALAPAPAKERLPGKRSRTDYKQFSVLLKRQTHKQAVRALDDLENGQDFSDLMEQLLEKWLTSHKNTAS